MIIFTRMDHIIDPPLRSIFHTANLCISKIKYDNNLNTLIHSNTVGFQS